MKSKSSKLAVLFVGLVYLATSLIHFSHQEKVKVTTWDALGYYMYLPATFIYNDLPSLAFYPAIEKKYKLQGKENEFYQFSKIENGHYAGKYFIGVAVLQSPFFFAGHAFASSTSYYPADGFSAPYQIGIILAALFYLLLGLWILRWCLRKMFSENTVTYTILLLGLATNLIQYSAVDVGQSHVYIFFLYAAILFFTMQWHKTYRKKTIFFIGFTIGLAAIGRPTEIIMFFIPLLWNISDKEAWKFKLKKLFKPNGHILIALLGLVSIAFFQLLYWKLTTDQFIYNVGSKWHFFNPHWRVLFGFEKGWFIYTPVTFFFILGFITLKKSQQRVALLTFSFLNIWIIIAWADWHYGGSYSTRALVQSYPIFAIPFAALIDRVLQQKLKILFLVLSGYLIMVNLFQLYQYNTGVLHFDKMNKEYYKKIYLNPNVSEEDKKYRSP